MERYLLTRRDPFKVLLLGLLVFSSATQLATAAVPGSVDALMPHWVHIAFLIDLLFGCAVALFGCYWRDIVTAIFAERYGITIAEWGIGIYGLAVLIELAAKGLITFVLCIAFAYGFELRRRQLTRLVRKLPKK